MEFEMIKQEKERKERSNKKNESKHISILILGEKKRGKRVKEKERNEI